MKKIIALLLAVLMVFSLVACGAKSEAPASPAAPAADAPKQDAPKQDAPKQDAPAAEPAAPEAAEKTTGGSIAIGTVVDVATCASWRIRSNQEKMILGSVYEPLMHYDNDGNLVPYLAESLTADQAAKTYTVKLREGITFSDGSPLDGDALLWNFENFKENSQTSATHFGDVESFEKTDDMTVVIHLKEWNTQIPFSLNSVAGLMYSKKAFEDNGYDWCLENPVGTGPYMMTEIVPDDHKTVVANPNYWNKDGGAAFDQITFKIVSDLMSAQATLLNGELDAFFLGDFQFQNTMKAAGFSLNDNKMWYTIYFLIYGSAVPGSPLEDVRVRQAIAYAVNSEEIANTIDYGMSFVSSQYAVDGTPFFNPDVKGYEYNPEKAKALLAEAGYPDGFTTKIAVGIDQSLDRYMVAAQGYLKDVGINLELDYQEVAVWTSTGIYETDEGMILAGHGFGANLVNQAVSNFSKRAVEGVGMLKNSKIHPDDLDDALMTALRATSDEEMFANMHEAERLIIDEYCLGYPICIATGQRLTCRPGLIDAGCVAGYNEMPNFNYLYAE